MALGPSTDSCVLMCLHFNEHNHTVSVALTCLINLRQSNNFIAFPKPMRKSTWYFKVLVWLSSRTAKRSCQHWLLLPMVFEWTGLHYNHMGFASLQENFSKRLAYTAQCCCQRGLYFYLCRM